MKQPERIKNNVRRQGEKKKTRTKRKHPEYGTSKLEDKFAKNFLDFLGVKYERQYLAKDIGRYYDFFIIIEGNYGILCEIDGDYWHGYDLIHENKNPMQKHNERVDRQKDNWAIAHKIPLIRIWEHDINENPVKVMEELKEIIMKYSKDVEMFNNKKKRH